MTSAEKRTPEAPVVLIADDDPDILTLVAMHCPPVNTLAAH